MACNINYGSLARGECPNNFGVIKKIFLGALVDDAGNENKFDTIADVTKANFLTKINNANTDPSTALFPLGTLLENVTDERGDQVVEEMNSGNIFFIRKGVRQFEGFLPLESWQLIEQLSKWRNIQFGIYVADQSGNFGFMMDKTLTEVKLMPVIAQSLGADEIAGGDDTTNKVRVRFTFDATFDASKFRSIDLADLDFDPRSNIDLPALIELNTILTSADATQIDFTVKTVEGLAVENIELADVTLDNITSASEVTLTGVTHSGNGVYVATYATGVTGGDVLQLSIDKAGYFSYTANQQTIVAVVP